MSKKNLTNGTELAELGVNTPERGDETEEKKFFTDIAESEEEEPSEDAGEDNPDASNGNDTKEPEEADKGIIAFIKKNWKKLLIAGALTIAGGIIFVYFMGKTYKVDASKILPFKKKDLGKLPLSDGESAKVYDFAEEAKKMANEMMEQIDKGNIEKVDLTKEA